MSTALEENRTDSCHDYRVHSLHHRSSYRYNTRRRGSKKNRVAPAESQNRRHLSDVTNWREPAVKDFQEEMSKESSLQNYSKTPKNKEFPGLTRRSLGRFILQSAAGKCQDERGCDQRPLVIIIPWLRAKQNHVSKYSELYLRKGLDVLVVQVTPSQIIRPIRTKRIVKELLSLLQDENGPLAKRPLIIHGFSIGAFVWGQMLLEMNSDIAILTKAHGDKLADDLRQALKYPDYGPQQGDRGDDAGAPPATTNTRSSTDDDSKSNSAGHLKSEFSESCTSGQEKERAQDGTMVAVQIKFAEVHRRILGVIMDSPTPMEAILVGMPNSVTSRPIFRAVLRIILAAYIRSFPSSVGIHYLQGARAAEKNDGGYPTLILYSSTDAVVPAPKVDAVVADWFRKGFFVRVKKWEQSPHVAHFQFHPEEYTEEVYGFLDSLLTPKSRL
ncbi:uncharacterized protein LOC112564151 isoform X2 [Pomacea canaliculata]|uniref:uncharacterized protein LOC112564151 isoform X2 n=1 Tax=Pomacea canaliculata TaxID=400727 RepID=UPI000D738258|nr:uncharacterized protein LOC112564151 isoform X2 [Pomacea canaliculata]